MTHFKTGLIALLAGFFSMNQTGWAEAFGIKSCGSSSSTCSQNPRPISLPPAVLFSFSADGGQLTDLGVIQLNDVDIDADGLAYSFVHGLMAFALEKIGTQTSGSTLIALSPESAEASVIGPFMEGRDIRGAVFDSNEVLWVIDAEMNELLRIDPASGELLEPPIALSAEGISFDVSDASDIAVDLEGTFFLMNVSDLYQLNELTGEATLLHTELGFGLAGGAFSYRCPQSIILGFEVNGQDDILKIEAGDAFANNILFGDIIPNTDGSSINAGRGDLATSLPLFIDDFDGCEVSAAPGS